MLPDKPRFFRMVFQDEKDNKPQEVLGFSLARYFLLCSCATVFFKVIYEVPLYPAAPKGEQVAQPEDSEESKEMEKIASEQCLRIVAKVATVSFRLIDCLPRVCFVLVDFILIGLAAPEDGALSIRHSREPGYTDKRKYDERLR